MVGTDSDSNKRVVRLTQRREREGGRGGIKEERVTEREKG